MDEVTPPAAPFSDRRVLVTGGAGFIGHHLVSALVPDNDVRVLDNCSTGDPDTVPPEATLVRGDVTDAEAVRRAMDGVDVVFHQAAVVSVQRAAEQPHHAHRVNVDGTLTVLEAARDEDARAVVASSAAVYGSPDTVPVAEDDRLMPRSTYGVDKLAADSYARVYSSTYDVPTVALRYFNVYGPGQRGPYSGVVDAFLGRAAAGEPLVIHGDGEQTRDFVHVYDVVRANLAAATTDHTGRAFNVGTGESVTIRELADVIRSVLDAPVDLRYEEPRTGDVRHSRAATARLLGLLDVRPRVGLEAGLEQLAAHRRHVSLQG
ncbi:NAD-dependent epimerase/dehydratase family protein [Halorubrum sp. JWXQ-INN 858]|uniref:NAD-dependent epimerase/dehydratase family protein n=1 Tax=Halorubrum sp. JWXQ-INN 858 TaxID=2690782 RepID=UPI001359551C|nr:NAD-dependent epimerase/dehydratase family protein [Halorubrum sp. JWXQ-INN 858]MWV65485.1 NAD-dependent epimerase/dehydratase family protein [Halorubrum sp. JWXQ-INN 858]